MVAATAEERKAFGDRLKDLRLHNSLSQRELAEQLSSEDESVTGANVGAWERGEYGPRRRATVAALEQILNDVGGLAPLLGYHDPTTATVDERLKNLEDRQAQQERQLAELLRRRRAKP